MNNDQDLERRVGDLADDMLKLAVYDHSELTTKDFTVAAMMAIGFFYLRADARERETLLAVIEQSVEKYKEYGVIADRRKEGELHA